MRTPPTLDRRTVLRTITGAALGGGLATGSTTAAARGGRGLGRGTPADLELVAHHDHATGDHALKPSTRELDAGWTTIEFENPTEHTHFAYLQRVPAAAIAGAEEAGMELLDYWIDRITQPFQVFMDFLLGKVTEPPSFPGWLIDIGPAGGPGLTAGGHTSRTTVHLEPGEYLVECYVKNAENEFHSYHGMIDHLTVTEDGSATDEPVSTLDLGLSTDGIDVDRTVRPGRHTVAVSFDDQTVYPHLLRHDVHLIRLEGDTDLDDVAGWMDWSNGMGGTGDQLVSDGSEPMAFVGGVQDLPPGETGYLHVTLRPGTYAWVAEVPAPRQKELLVPFTVPFGRG